MDTLCIPVKAEHADLRKKTIDDMASIYVGAKAVLVLDQGLIKTSGRADYVSPIISSVWMCRSWTLQEGILSPLCVIQFADGFAVGSSGRPRGSMTWWSDGKGNPDDEEEPKSASKSTALQVEEACHIAEHIPTPNSILRSHLIETLFSIRMKPTTDKQSTDVLNRAFLSTWNALAGRSTTKSEDIYLILANIMDIDHESLRDRLPEERMQRILLSLGELPFSLFFHAKPTNNTFESRLNRWLPLEPSNCILTGSSTVQIQSDRLTVVNRDLAYYEVKAIIPPSLKTFSITVVDGYSYYFETLCAADDSFETANLTSTFLVIEDSVTGTARHRNGAVFYARGSYPPYSVIFSRSARIRKNPDEGTLELTDNTNQPPIFEALAVKNSASVTISYGMFL